MALDPFPFNGHTTTCDACGKACPWSRCRGKPTFAIWRQRPDDVGTRIDLIARTPPQYIEIATRLARDRHRLNSFARDLRQQMAASPLIDFQAFTRNLEAEYRKMWIAWCKSRIDLDLPVSTNS